MKKIIFILILLSTGLTAQTYQDTLAVPSNEEIVTVIAAYGMASMMADAMWPTYDNYNARVTSSLVKVAVILAAKQYVKSGNLKKTPSMLLQAAIVAMAIYDLKSHGGL